MIKKSNIDFEVQNYIRIYIFEYSDLKIYKICIFRLHPNLLLSRRNSPHKSRDPSQSSHVDKQRKCADSDRTQQVRSSGVGRRTSKESSHDCRGKRRGRHRMTFFSLKIVLKNEKVLKRNIHPEYE